MLCDFNFSEGFLLKWNKFYLSENNSTETEMNSTEVEMIHSNTPTR